MVLIAEQTSQFHKDLRLAKRRGKDLRLIQKVMYEIIHEQLLDRKYKDHFLLGKWNEHRELHIQPDWLLIYKLQPQIKVVRFVRTGSHADLF